MKRRPDGPEAVLGVRPGDPQASQGDRGAGIWSDQVARQLDRFRLPGLEQVNGEWALITTTRSLLKLFRAKVARA